MKKPFTNAEKQKRFKQKRERLGLVELRYVYVKKENVEKAKKLIKDSGL